MPVDLLPDQQGDKPWHTEKWSQRHRLVVALHLAGNKNVEIAEMLDYSPAKVSIILNDPRAVYEIEKMAASVADRTIDAQVRFKLLANEALDEIVEEMRTCRDPRVRQKAAFGILDRAGYTPTAQKDDREKEGLPAGVLERMEATTRELTENTVEYKNVLPVPVQDDDADAN